MASSDDFPLINTSSHLHTPTRLRGAIDSTATTNNGDFFPRPFPEEPDRSPNPTRTPNTRSSYYYKKLKPSFANPNPTTSTPEAESSSGPDTGSHRGDYRKDREEWNDTAIACLLEAYTEKFNQLSRGNLRGRDWEEVAEMVSDRCGTSGVGNRSTYKSVEQCKNKIDNLKKRYKVELQRVNSTGLGVSHWHWFKKLEAILGSLVSPRGGGGGSDEERSGRGNSNLAKQVKRYTSGSAAFGNSLKAKPMPNLKWRRVMLKISGAALAGDCQSVNSKVAMQIAGEVATACRLGVEVAIVLGGSNFFCGDTWVSSTGLDRSTAYQIGMMATVMNSVLLQSAFEKVGIQARVQTALPMPEVSEPYNRLRAIRHLEKGRVVIFGGIGSGTGNYLFTTDVAAALRASEINAEAVAKGTNCNGICECHGNISVTVDHICYKEASSSVASMDDIALQYCKENGLPVIIFNLLEPGNISRALCGDDLT